MYSIEFTKAAQSDLNSLEDTIKERIYSTLERVSVSPHRYIRKLAGSPAYRMRVGDYRIIVWINEKMKQINVLRVGKRDCIYL